jgi:phosphopantothenoylcysteine decarboxylase/phosphopantothenate--cysteine ligase
MRGGIFKDIKVLITAGPTREALDPVRYISNHSSGKMGYAIAESFLQQGAEVVLITGPVGINLKHEDLKTVNINSASEMYLACCRYFEIVDIAVFAAAVAGYRPAKISDKKIKKEEDGFTIHMVKNIDIAAEFGKVKGQHQISVGFALETNDELKHAICKLQSKNFDMVILNSVNDSNAAFGYDTNKISIIKRDLTVTNYPLKNKAEVASDIILETGALLASKEIRSDSLLTI